MFSSRCLLSVPALLHFSVLLTYTFPLLSPFLVVSEAYFCNDCFWRCRRVVSNTIKNGLSLFLSFYRTELTVDSKLNQEFFYCEYDMKQKFQHVWEQILLLHFCVTLNRSPQFSACTCCTGIILIVPPFTLKNVLARTINNIINQILRPNRFRAFSQVR